MFPHPKPCLCALLALAALLSQPTRASWGYAPPEHSVSAAYVVVTGTIVHVSWNKAKRGVRDGKKYKYRYRIARIEVEEVLKNDLLGMPLRKGSVIEFPMSTKRARSSLSFSFEKGARGVWLLGYSDDTLQVYWPGARMPPAKLDEVRRILRELDVSYQEALKEKIPTAARKWQEILALPPYPQSKIDSLIGDGKGLPPGLDPAEVYVLNPRRKPMETLFLDARGKVVGGIPYHASASAFSEGRLRVSTRLRGNAYTDYRLIDRDGELLPDYQGRSSEGLSMVKSKGLYGFVDSAGNEVVPCIYDRAMPFSGGMSRVVKGGQALLITRKGEVVYRGSENEIPLAGVAEGLAHVNVRGNVVGYVDLTGKLAIDTKGRGYVAERRFKGGFSRVWIVEDSRTVGSPHRKRALLSSHWRKRGFIDRKGELIFPPMVAQFSDYSEGLVAFRGCQTADTWGYMDTEGKVVIAPQFLRARDFSDGRAAVDYSWWIKRPPLFSRDGTVHLSPKAPRHFLGTRRGYIDRAGNLINPIGFDGADDFRNGLARVDRFLNRKVEDTFDAIMDREGRIVLVLSNPLANTADGEGK